MAVMWVHAPACACDVMFLGCLGSSAHAHLFCTWGLRTHVSLA